MALKDRPRSFHGLATPVRGATHRLAYAGLVVVAFAMLLVGRADVILVDRFRAAVIDASAPILDAASRPAAAVSRFSEQISDFFALRDEVDRLRIERERLLHWQMVARKLETENKSLKGLLNFSPAPEESFVTARVIGDAGGAFVHSLILNAGTRDGVRRNQAVITGEGLVGRVASVGARAARVLLITDLNSRIPVAVESTRMRAVLAGDNTDEMNLVYLPPGASAVPGDRIVTSGHGGAFPVGIPVGVVTAAEEGKITVRPFVSRERIEYVRVVNYGFQSIWNMDPLLPDGGKGGGSTGK